MATADPGPLGALGLVTIDGGLMPVDFWVRRTGFAICEGALIALVAVLVVAVEPAVACL